jgi:hypothetical protein
MIFTWAADRIIFTMWQKGPNGVDIHFLYKTTHNLFKTGKTLQPKTIQLMDIYNKLLAIIHTSSTP